MIITKLKNQNIKMLGFLFLFVYAPVFILPFNIIHILAIISYFFLFTKYSNRFQAVLQIHEIRMFLILQMLFLIYNLILVFTLSDDYSALYYAASAILEIVPIAIFVSLAYMKLRFDRNKFYDALLIIGMIQVSFVAFSYNFPSFRDWIFENSGSEGYDINEKVYRIFGFARGYTFSMPLFQGFCIIIAMVLGAFKSKKYFLLIPFYLFSIILNARIALISFLIVSMIILYFGSRKNFLKIISSLGVIFILIMQFIHIIAFKSEQNQQYDTWSWLNAGIIEVQSLIKGDATGNLYYLTDAMWFAPDVSDMITGTGENVFGKNIKSSDIGYVVNFYYGGLIYSILIYVSYLALLIKYSKHDKIEKVIFISLIFYLFIANLKGNVFRPNEIINGVIVFVFFTVIHRKYAQLR